MLAYPVEKLQLSKDRDIAVSSIAFQNNENATFWVGSEESIIFQSNRFPRAGQKSGITNVQYIGKIS
jgi:dynein intermediate chain